MRTIVVGVDGSEDSRLAVAWTADLAGPLGARVVAVHAVGLLEHERGDPEAHHLLPKLTEWIADLGVLPASSVDPRLIQGDPVEALLRVARDEPADLVVVGSRGIGARTGTMLGSTSLELAERCPCPLVIVPRWSAPAD
ncbi:MAG: universal stress protein [Acidimicrobiales bacterium]